MRAPTSREPGKPARHLDRLQEAWNRFLCGRRPDDPLYLSNRSWKKKALIGSLVAVPVLVLGSLLTVALTHRVIRDMPAPKQLTPAEILASAVPELNKEINLDANPDLEVADVGVDRSGDQHAVTGTIRNKADYRYESVFVGFDLTNSEGSQVGAATTHSPPVAPRSTTRIRVLIPQKNVAFVLVREIRGTR